MESTAFCDMTRKIVDLDYVILTVLCSGLIHDFDKLYDILVRKMWDQYENPQYHPRFTSGLPPQIENLLLSRLVKAFGTAPSWGAVGCQSARHRAEA